MKIVAKSIFVLCAFIICSINGFAEKPVYREYRSTASPLYSPWFTDAVFLDFCHRSFADVGLPLDCIDKRYVLFCALKQALKSKEGVVIECGAHKGASAHFMGFIIDRFSERQGELLVLDSFEGFPSPTKEDICLDTNQPFFFKGGHANTSFQEVKAVLNNHRCAVQVIKGWIPYSFSGLEEKKFNLAHIDVDLYQPTLDSLKFIYDRMVPGGVIVFDDYGFPMCPGAREAVDLFLADKPEILLPLPTGQALLYILPKTE